MNRQAWQMKRYWTNLNKTLNEFIQRDNYKHSLRLSHTGLFPMHEVGRGPNSGEPTLLEFCTKEIEATAIHFHWNTYRHGGGSVMIMYRSSTDCYGDETFLEYRKGNKTDYMILPKYRTEESLRWDVKDSLKEVGITDFDNIDLDDIKNGLIKSGYKILNEFTFTGMIEFRMPHHYGRYIWPEYIKTLKDGMEIGWVSSGTYNALPNVLKLKRVNKGIKSVRLDSLGIETKGDYDHHYKCKVLPEQVKQAKRFFSKRFKQKRV